MPLLEPARSSSSSGAQARASRGSGPQASYAGGSEQDALNTFLDAWEGSTRALIEAGAEPQMRARLARLLPGKDSVAGPVQDLDPLTLSNLLTTCRTLERFKLTADVHASIGVLKAWLMGQLPSRADRGRA